MARKRAYRRAVPSMAVDIFAVGETGCSCTCGSFSFTFNLRSCIATPNNAALFNGITVNVYTNSGMGTLLASGTTSGSGAVTLSWSGVAGTYYVTVPAYNARWTNYAASLSLTPSGGNIRIALPTNTAGGYVCCTNIDIPIHSPLHYTDSSGCSGGCSLTWTSSCNASSSYAISGIYPIFNTCNTTTGTTTIAYGIRQGSANVLTIFRDWYVYSGLTTCYCDTTRCGGTNFDGAEDSVNFTIASIAIPLAFTVTPTGSWPGYAVDPVTGSVTVSE